jgi:protein-L-isoaspartate(D-aspartate) O-methyltransferase
MNKKIVTAEKRWIYVSAVLLFLLTILAIIPAIEETKRPLMLFASRDIKIDANLVSEKDPNKPQHKHPAFKERSAERVKMVAAQIQAREVKDPNVLAAMRIVPRHAFIPGSEKSLAYIDSALPIAKNQTISQPYIVAFMTQALRLKNNSKVLEIGAGSGYQAAVCAEIAKEVYTIEIVEELAKSAEKVLKELGYTNVFVKFGDGFFGWPEHAPFDAIIGTAAADQIPQPLIDQLKPGGRMIIPYEEAGGLQYLVLIIKDNKGELHKETVLPVRFVPMTGEVEKSALKTDK